ncbi:transposase domain-containing protein [Paracoccaceae bacterium Fryx2]|nr:transposase domain-containing protein [Paracoccaceae bacterium Fryx2]
MAHRPSQEWWTTEEIAASGLPDLPQSRQGVEQVIKRNSWRAQPGLARRRSGRGGGWEYSWKLFPTRAQKKLLQAVAVSVAPARPERSDAWAWFDGLPDSVKAQAKARLLIIQKVEALESSLGRHMAVTEVACLDGVGARTVWNWLAMIDGVRVDDRLPYLAPRHRAAAERSRHKDCDPDFFGMLKSDFLRLEGPSFSSCYRQCVSIAKSKGWDVLPERTMRRRLDASVSAVTQVLARSGIDAVKRMFPMQVRDKTSLVALEAVNADFHKFDVFVKWPGLRGEAPQIVRPQMVAFQDIYSGRILAWWLDVTPNSTAVLLCAGDMIERWGIPHHVLLDNGREFAAKAITGGASTRYRFKVREDDIPGLFVSLGCEIHWATPYSGQSKPIERSFRDMCDAIAKDPRFAGAYTGNRPDAKPENYGSKAIDLEVFRAVVAEGIEEHNTRQGRRSEVAWGRSFAEVFDESYACAPIRKATEAQRRLWLLGAEGLRADSKSGRVKFMGNEYWSDWMHAVAGQRLIIRFDPADLHAGVHVYSQDNAYLGHAPCELKGQFFDVDGARELARRRNTWLASEKAAEKAHKRFTAAEMGEALDAIAPALTPDPEAKVVRATFGKAPARPELPQDGSAIMPPAAVDKMQAALVADLSAHRAPKAAAAAEESALERFRRALDLDRLHGEGRSLTVEQQRWLSHYQSTSEYRGQLILWQDRGDAIFG